MNLLTRFFSNTKVKYDVMNKLIDEIEARDSDLENRKVDKTTTINNKSLTGNVTITQDDVTSGTTNKAYTSTEQSKLSGVATGATKVDQSGTNGNIRINDVEKQVYAHPSTHTASMIVEDATKRFVSDTEKATWNGKETPTGAQSKADAAVTAAKTYTDTVKTTLETSIATKTTTSLNDVATNVNFIGSNGVVETVNGNKFATNYNLVRNEDGVEIFRGRGNLVLEYMTDTYYPRNNSKILTPLPATGYTSYKINVKGLTYVSFNNSITKQWAWFTDANSQYIADYAVSDHVVTAPYLLISIPPDAVYIYLTRFNSAIDLVALGGKVDIISSLTIDSYPIGKARAIKMLNKAYSLNTSLVKIVDINGFGDYYTPQQAIDDITDDSSSKRYTILILQGTYPKVSMGRNVNDKIRFISFIGVEKEKCIIRDDTGLYENAPLNAKSVGTFKNLTFIATHTATPSWDGSQSGSYAMHADFGFGLDMTFENCDFISYQQATIGIGVWDMSMIKFVRCNFYRYGDATQGAEYGAVFIHTTNHVTVNTANNWQKIWIEDCNIISNVGTKSCYFVDTANIGSTYYDFTFIKNMVYCDTTGQTGALLNKITPSKYSFGNNDALLNA